MKKESIMYRGYELEENDYNYPNKRKFDYIASDEGQVLFYAETMEELKTLIDEYLD